MSGRRCNHSSCSLQLWQFAIMHSYICSYVSPINSLPVIASFNNLNLFTFNATREATNFKLLQHTFFILIDFLISGHSSRTTNRKFSCLLSNCCLIRPFP